MKPSAISLLFLAAFLAACSDAKPFPVPSATHDSAKGFSFEYPANGVVELLSVSAPQLEAGRVRGAAKLADALVPYNIRYSLVQVGPQYPERIVIDVEKGRCLTEPGCKPLRKDSRTDGPLTVMHQEWPDEQDSVLHVRLVQRGDRILKLSWNVAKGEPGNLVAEAVADSVTMREAAPAPVVPAPSSAPAGGLENLGISISATPE